MHYAVENESLGLRSRNHSGSVFKAFAYMQLLPSGRSPREDNLKPKGRTELIKAKPQGFIGQSN